MYANLCFCLVSGRWPVTLLIDGSAEDYIWVVDDDVRLPTGEISKMFQTLSACRHLNKRAFVELYAQRSCVASSPDMFFVLSFPQPRREHSQIAFASPSFDKVGVSSY